MLSQILTGKTVLSVEILDHGFCSVALSEGFHLSFESLGRFIGTDGTFITTQDHGHRFGLSTPFDAAAHMKERLKGRKIERVTVRSDTNDLILWFSSGSLEVLCTSSGFEAYQVRGPQNLIVVARGGKEEPNQSPELTAETGRGSSLTFGDKFRPLNMSLPNLPKKQRDPKWIWLFAGFWFFGETIVLALLLGSRAALFGLGSCGLAVLALSIIRFRSAPFHLLMKSDPNQS